MREDIRRTAYLAVFGAVWGGNEMIMGGILHAMHIPMRGMVMAAIGAFLVCSAKIWIGGRWTALTMGGIAAFLKLFSLGGLVVSPAVAILVESAIAELCFAIFRGKLLPAVATGMGMVTYTVIHRIASMMIIYQSEMVEIFGALSAEGSIFYKLGLKSMVIIIILYTLMHILIGAIVGSAAYFSVNRASKRLLATAET